MQPHNAACDDIALDQREVQANEMTTNPTLHQPSLRSNGVSVSHSHNRTDSLSRADSVSDLEEGEIDLRAIESLRVGVVNDVYGRGAIDFSADVQDEDDDGDSVSELSHGIVSMSPSHLTPPTYGRTVIIGMGMRRDVEQHDERHDDGNETGMTTDEIHSAALVYPQQPTALPCANDNTRAVHGNNAPEVTQTSLWSLPLPSHSVIREADGNGAASNVTINDTGRQGECAADRGETHLSDGDGNTVRQTTKQNEPVCASVAVTIHHDITISPEQHELQQSLDEVLARMYDAEKRGRKHEMPEASAFRLPMEPIETDHHPAPPHPLSSSRSTSATSAQTGPPRFINQPIPSVLSAYQPSAEIVCGICWDPIPPMQLHAMPQPSCKHQFCVDCWQRYLLSRLQTDLVLHIPCPHRDESACRRELTHDEVMARLMSNHECARYERLVGVARLASDPSVRWCPNPRCARLISSSSSTSSARRTFQRSGRIACSECGTEVCKRCGEVWHPSITCTQAAKQAMKPFMTQTADGCPSSPGTAAASSSALPSSSVVAAHEKSSSTTLTAPAPTSASSSNDFIPSSSSAMLKRCPCCGMAVIRVAGCNFVRCSYCSAEWCWLCQGSYTDDHFAWWNVMDGCPLMHLDRWSWCGDESCCCCSNACFAPIKRTLLRCTLMMIYSIAFLLALPFMILAAPYVLYRRYRDRHQRQWRKEIRRDLELKSHGGRRSANQRKQPTNDHQLRNIAVK